MLFYAMLCYAMWFKCCILGAFLLQLFPFNGTFGCVLVLIHIWEYFFTVCDGGIYTAFFIRRMKD